MSGFVNFVVAGISGVHCAPTPWKCMLVPIKSHLPCPHLAVSWPLPVQTIPSRLVHWSLPVEKWPSHSVSSFLMTLSLKSVSMYSLPSPLWSWTKVLWTLLILQVYLKLMCYNTIFINSTACCVERLILKPKCNQQSPWCHVFLQRGRKRGGRGAAPPPFARDDNFLSTAIPLHTSVYRTNGNISNCLPHTF